MLVNKMFAIATKTVESIGDKWENRPATYSEVLNILIGNGWTIEQANQELDITPNHWILVNDFTQIC